MIINFTHVWKDSRITLDLDELSRTYCRKDLVCGWGDRAFRTATLYTKAKLKRLIKHLESYRCDHTKAEILDAINNEKLKKDFDELYAEGPGW